MTRIEAIRAVPDDGGKLTLTVWFIANGVECELVVRRAVPPGASEAAKMEACRKVLLGMYGAVARPKLKAAG